MSGVLSFGEIPLRYHFVTLVNKCHFVLRALSWPFSEACFPVPPEATGPLTIVSSNPCLSLIQKNKSAYLAGVQFCDLTSVIQRDRDQLDGVC